MTPDTQQIDTLEDMIGGVINGKDFTDFEPELSQILNDLFNRGAERILLGCTELELIMQHSDNPELIRPLELTVQSIINRQLPLLN